MFTTSKRNAKFEFVRVIAMVLVLFYYITKAFPLNDGLNHSGLVFSVFSVFYKLAAPLFLLLCGRFALNLDFSNKSLKEFYFKKMVYILIPMLFFMTFQYFLDFTNNINDFNFFSFLPFLTAAYNNLHYWFMYDALFYILSAPILSLAFKDISDRGVISFVSIGLIYSICYFYIPLIPEAGFSYSNQFGKLIFYFFLGGVSDRFTNIIGKKKLYIAGAVSFIVVVLQTRILESYTERYDASPFYVIFTLALYIFLTSLYKEGNKYTDKTLLFLGKYSFYVCMIQGILMKRIVDYGILPTDNFWLFVSEGTAIVLVASVVLSVLIDTIIFRFLRICLYHLFSVYNNIK